MKLTGKCFLPPRYPCSIKFLFLPLFIISSIFVNCDTGSPGIPTETVGTPTASPGAGELESGTVVSLSTTTEGASIYYSLDGNEPSENSEKYTGPISISAALTIKAFGVKQGMINSSVLTAAYTVKEVKNTDPKSITLTDFTDAYTGEWQIILVPSKTNISMADIVAVLQAVPAANTISGALLVMTDGGSGSPWTGNDKCYLCLVPRHPNEHLDVYCYISKEKVSFNQTETQYSFTSNFTYAVQPGFHGAYTLNSTYSGGNTGTLNLFSTRLELTDSVNGVDVYTLNGWYINGTGTWLYLWDTDADTKIGLVFSGDSGNKLIATGQTASAQLKTELETMGFTGIDVSDIGAEIYDLYGEEP